MDNWQDVTEGVIMGQFMAMRIKHPYLDEAHALFDAMRQSKRDQAWEPQKYATMFAPSQSGKTMTVRTYLEGPIAEEAIRRGLFPPNMPRAEIARLQRIALHVTLSPSASSKTIASDGLRAFNDPRASTGTKESLLARFYHYCQVERTEMVFWDEMQHISDRIVKVDDRTERGGVVGSSAVTDTLKTMLLHGLVPMVYVGTPDARTHFTRDVQLASRCIRELDVGTLDLSNPQQARTFSVYLGKLSLKLKLHGLFAEDSNLLEGDLIECIHEVSLGRLGMASNLVLAACLEARRMNASRLERVHLEAATDDWAMRMGIAARNPFRDGPSRYQVNA